MVFCKVHAQNLHLFLRQSRCVPSSDDGAICECDMRQSWSVIVGQWDSMLTEGGIGVVVSTVIRRSARSC